MEKMHWKSKLFIVIGVALIALILYLVYAHKSMVNDLKDQLVQTENDAWIRNNVDGYDKLFEPDCTLHIIAQPDLHGVEALKQSVKAFHTAVAIIYFHIDDIFTADDKIVERYTWQGKLNKNGNLVNISGCVIYKMKSNKITEAWNYEDTYTYFQSLGM